MFTNLIRHSLRSLKRQRAYVIINIMGLSSGIACSLLIALYVINELVLTSTILRKIEFSGLYLTVK